MNNKIIKSYHLYFVPLLVICFFLSLVLLLSCNNKLSKEQYGFITKLGDDTISVESITKQGNTITTDEVDRFPRVRIRHTVIDLNDDGSIKHLAMDIHTPSEPANERERRVVADVSNNVVHLSKTDGTGTVKRDFATGGSIVVAHVPMMYSLYELYFVAALKHAAATKLPLAAPYKCGNFILIGSLIIFL